MNIPSVQINGALLGARARLRPMGVGDILDATFDLYRDNFLLFLATTSVLLAPLLLAGVVVGLGVLSIDASGSGTIAMGTALKLLSVVAALAGGVAGLLVAAAVTVVAARRYLGQPVTVRSAYAAALRRFWALLLALLWAGLRLLPIVALSAFLIGYPFLIYYSLAWVLIPQAVLLDGYGAGRASKRSRELLSGSWWRTLGLYLALAALLGVLAVIPTTLLTAVLGEVGTSAADSSPVLVTVYAAIGAVVPVLLAPPALIAATLLYYDLKVRKEAFDLEVMAAIEARRAALPHPGSPAVLQ